MPSKPRAGLAAFWTTHLAKALCGDQPCALSTWLPAHTILEKRVREDASSLALWKVNHTEQLNAVVEQRRAEGWKVDVERFFKVTGSSAIISGKADAVCQKPDCRPQILDVKSGQPRESDILQVAIEMILIPLAWNVSMTFMGSVIYPTHHVAVTPEQADALKPKLFALVKHLGLCSRPQASPSESACKFCDVNESDCPDRFGLTPQTQIVEPIPTSLF